MNETNKDDLGYLGASFQMKVLWQLLTVPEFAEDIVPVLTASYFDNQLHKFIMSMIKKYHEEHAIPANLKNRSIYEYIGSSNKSEVDKELAYGVLNQIKNYDLNVINGQQFSDASVIQKTIWLFVKQQESKKLANDIFDKIKTGDLEDNVHYFEDKFKDIMKLGAKHDLGEDVFYDPEDALRKDYREPIPTGIKVMDEAMGGGLGKGEMGLALMAYGVGKTTFLCKAANTAYEVEKNVLQIFFEDNVNDIKRKHYTLWSKIPLSQLEEKREDALELVKNHQNDRTKLNRGGRLILKKMDQENTTIPDIKNWILNYQKTYGIKFDIIILDYLDCVEPHKAAHGDQNKAELIVVKAFESLLGELNIPGWSAVQGNRTAVRSEFVHGDQMGGNIKRAQKTHFLFSVAKSLEQKQDGLANIQIIKSRMTRDGQVYENAIFNNDTLEIRCIEGIRPSSKSTKDKIQDQPLENLSFFKDMMATYVDNEVRGKHKNDVEKNNSTDTQEDNKSEAISAVISEK